MYKCCWNCQYGKTCCFKTEYQEKLFNSTKRFCFAPQPKSSHAENPYKQRYCKQFEARFYFPVSGKPLTKAEADRMLEMDDKGKIEYWEENYEYSI